jgi:hypothetical protein
MRSILQFPARLVFGLLGILSAPPALAQRVVPSTPIDSGKMVFVVPRRDAPLSPAPAARMPVERFPGLLVGYRADSIVLRSWNWRGRDGSPPPARPCPTCDETLAIPAHAVDHLEVPGHDVTRQRVESGTEGAFWATILGAVVGAVLGGGDAALLGAGVGAVVGFVGGALSPDPNHGTCLYRVTLRVVPNAGAREPHRVLRGCR